MADLYKWLWGDDEADFWGDVAPDYGFGYDDEDYRQAQEEYYFGEATPTYKPSFSYEPQTQYGGGDLIGEDPYGYYTQPTTKAETYYDQYSFLNLEAAEEEEAYEAEQMEAYEDEYGEKSYAEIARAWLAEIAPFFGNAAKIQKFAKQFMDFQKGPQQAGQYGPGRRMQAPYTTNRSGSTAQVRANIQSSFQARDSQKVVRDMVSRSSAAETASAKISDSGTRRTIAVSNDLYDLIAGETKPKKGVTQQLPTTFRGLALSRRSRMTA